MLPRFQLEKKVGLEKAVFKECAKLALVISLNYFKKYLLVPISFTMYMGGGWWK